MGRIHYVGESERIRGQWFTCLQDTYRFKLLIGLSYLAVNHLLIHVFKSV